MSFDIRLLLLLALSLNACGGSGGGGGSGSGAGGLNVTTQTGFLNQLDGSSVSGAAGAGLSYTWRFESTPSGSSAHIDGADQENAEFEPDVPGTYVIRVDVSDGSSGTISFSADGPSTGWKRLGAVLDIRYGQDARHPHIATDAAGNPIVVWEETDIDAANLENVYAKRWDGTGWVQLGDTALDSDIGNDVFLPRVAVDPTDGNPVVAWVERDAGVRKVIVRKWDGSSAWTAMGGPLNIDAAHDANTVDIAIGADGDPVVAWSEYAPDGFDNVYDVFVKKWDGVSAWIQLGTAFDWDDIDKHPAVAIDPADGNPVVAWSQGGTVSTTYFGDLVVQKWDGANWVTMGSNFESAGFFGPEATAIAVGADGQPIVAWHESETQVTARDVGVRKYNGTDFNTSITTPSTAGEHSPAVLADPGDSLPVLAFATADSLLVKKWDGSAWSQYGQRVNYRSFPGAPSLASGADAALLIAWDGEPHATYSANIYVKTSD